MAINTVTLEIKITDLDEVKAFIKETKITVDKLEGLLIRARDYVPSEMESEINHAIAGIEIDG